MSHPLSEVCWRGLSPLYRQLGSVSGASGAVSRHVSFLRLRPYSWCCIFLSAAVKNDPFGWKKDHCWILSKLNVPGILRTLAGEQCSHLMTTTWFSFELIVSLRYFSTFFSVFYFYFHCFFISFFSSLCNFDLLLL